MSKWTGLRRLSFASRSRAGAGFSAYAAGGAEPKTVADFKNSVFKVAGATTTFESMFTFSRASEATYVDSNGVLQTAAVDEARRGHHRFEGGSWVNKGVLIETEARTNLLLNSDTLSTQDVTVNNAAHVLHFTGSGSITLSGAHSATLNGTGAGEENRVELHFTPSAGTLTVTVTGTVSNAQLEETTGQRSSYIPTAGSSVTRAADDLDIAAANMAYSATAMSFQMEGEMDYVDIDTADIVRWINWFIDGSNALVARLDTQSSLTGRTAFFQEKAGTGVITRGASGDYSPGIAVPYNVASRHTPTVINGAVDGSALTEATGTDTLPDLSATVFDLGFKHMGTIALFRQWDEDIGDSGIAEASS